MKEKEKDERRDQRVMGEDMSGAVKEILRVEVGGEGRGVAGRVEAPE